MKNYDDSEDDYNDLHDDNFDSDPELDDNFFDDDDEEDNSGPVTDEGALYFDMIQKLYATIEENGGKDPSLLQLEASLNKLTSETEEAEENTFYLEEAITVAQHLKKYVKNSPNIKRIYDNFMLDIVRFTDESAPGHHGEFYL